MPKSVITKIWVAGACSGCLLVEGLPAYAQTQPATPAGQTEELGEVVVTGTRIRTPGAVSPTPLTVLGQEQIDQVAPSTVDDFLAHIPQFRQDSGPTQVTRNSGSVSTGQSFADLRGLGAQRTLVLVDGQRPVPTNAQGTTSTSTIPLGLVSRVEVVTGGASAAYGSDAVAGVTNFILKDHLEGFQGSLFGGLSQRGDNQDMGVSLADGFAALDGRLHVVAGLDYDDNRGVGNIYSRSWSRVEPGNSGNPLAFGAARPAGTPANGWANGVEYATQTPGGVINTARTAAGTSSSVLNQLAFNPDGSTYKLVRGPVFGNLMINSSSNPLATPIAQWSLKDPLRQVASLVRATYDVTDDTQAFVQASYAYSHIFAISQYHQTATDTILSSNPYLPSGVRSLMTANNLTQFDMGRVDTEWLGTTGDNTSATVQISTGLKGKVFGQFHWDVTYNYGRSVLDSSVYGTREANLAAAEYAVLDANGNIVCGALATNPNFATNRQTNTITPAKVQPGCVPLNPFGVGNSSAAARAYVAGLEYTQDVMLRHDVALNLGGPLVDLPAGELSLATGAEYRYDSLEQSADPLQRLGLYSSGNNQAFFGLNDVKEVYAELDVPVLKNLPAIRSFNINTAARFTDYRTSGSVTTWKFGGTYEPVGGLRFRVTRSRDIRAPALFDLFNQGAFSATGSFTNPFNGQSARLPTQTAGNPSLTPEKADTLTTGVTYEPHDGWFSGGHVSVDYYRIKVRDVIASVAAADSVTRCFQGVSSYCSAITFDNSTFGIAKVLSQPFNQSLLDVEGIDLEAGYSHPLRALGLPGALELTTFATYLKHSRTTDRAGPSGVTTDYAGYQTAQPKWVVSAFVNYHLDPVAVGLEARGFSSIGYSPLYIGPDQAGYSPTLPNSISENRFPGFVYLNLNTTYDFQARGLKFQLFGNVNNLLDRDPPAYAIAAINLGGNPYDYVGRTFKAGVRLSF